MDKEWGKKREEWYQKEIRRLKEEIVNNIKTHPNLLNDKREELIEKFKIACESNIMKLYNLNLKLNYGYGDFWNCNKKEVEDIDMMFNQCEKWAEEIGIGELYKMLQYKESYDGSSYIDSEPMEFDGDIIITDPCYITKDDDWSKCEYGDKMEALGINTYMTRDTLYGDWSCTTFNSDTKKAIGQFCADAGLVSVMLLDEVKKYNPDFDYHEERPWTTTWIKNFKGSVQFVVVHSDGYYENESKHHKKGEYWEDYSVEVIGHGINKVTGEPINFVGRQTGL